MTKNYFKFYCVLIFLACPILSYATSDEYYLRLEKICQASNSPNCCLASLDVMRKNLFLEAVDKKCPAGQDWIMMKCESSLSWCVPNPSKANQPEAQQ